MVFDWLGIDLGGIRYNHDGAAYVLPPMCYSGFRLPPDAAVAKARDLFYSMLTKRQLADFKKTFSFMGRSESGSVYTIYAEGPRGHSFNVRFRNSVWCLTWFPDQTEKPPVYDKLLIQKLLLEGDEEAFVRYANAYPENRNGRIGVQIGGVLTGNQLRA